MAQLMPLPLTVSCFSKIQIGFTFLVPAHLGSPGKRAVKRVFVCVRAPSLLQVFWSIVNFEDLWSRFLHDACLATNYLCQNVDAICKIRGGNKCSVCVVVMAHKLMAIFPARFTELVLSTDCSGIRPFPCVDIYLVGVQMVAVHQWAWVHQPVMKWGVTMMNIVHIRRILVTCCRPTTAVPVNLRSLMGLRCRLLRRPIVYKFLPVTAGQSSCVTNHSTFPVVKRRHSVIMNHVSVAGQIVTHCQAISTRLRAITAQDPYLPCQLPVPLTYVMCHSYHRPSVQPPPIPWQQPSTDRMSSRYQNLSSHQMFCAIVRNCDVSDLTTLP